MDRNTTLHRGSSLLLSIAARAQETLGVSIMFALIAAGWCGTLSAQGPPYQKSLWICNDAIPSRPILNTDRAGNVLRQFTGTARNGVAVDPVGNIIYFGTYERDLFPMDLTTLASLPNVNTLRPYGADMAFDGRYVWRGFPWPPPTAVVKIDPITGNEVESFLSDFAMTDGAVGVAWDGGGLWLSDRWSFTVARFAKFGSVWIRTNEFKFPTFTWGLAYDWTDNSLWMGSHHYQPTQNPGIVGRIYHLTTSGTVLGFFDVPQLGHDPWVGGLEFEGCDDPPLACTDICSSSVPCGRCSVTTTIDCVINAQCPPGETCVPQPGCVRPSKQWISLPATHCLETVEELCAAIPTARTVVQRFPEPSLGAPQHSYDCDSHQCTPGPETGACGSSCFCLDPGEGYEVVTAGASRFQLNGSEGPVAYNLAANKNYLISVPFHTSMQDASDLLATIGAGPGEHVTVTRLDCTTNGSSVFRSFPPQGVDFPLVPGEAYQISSGVPMSFVLIPEVEPAYPVCACTDADGDGYGWPPYRGCPGSGIPDCRPTDPSLWSAPGEVRALVVNKTGGMTASWSPPLNPGGDVSLLHYDTLRSDIAGGFLATSPDPPHTCIESDDGSDTTSADSTNPPTGVPYFFLVRAENACGGGPLGLDDGNLVQPGRACPP